MQATTPLRWEPATVLKVAEAIERALGDYPVEPSVRRAIIGGAAMSLAFIGDAIALATGNPAFVVPEPDEVEAARTECY
jgi:hypothetical protein